MIQAVIGELTNLHGAMQSVYRAAHISAIASKPAEARSHLEVSKLASELSRVPLLATLDQESLRKLAEEVHLQVHLPGSVVMRQGDIGDKMFLLTEGCVSVMKMPEEELAIIRELGTRPESIDPILKDSTEVMLHRGPLFPCGATSFQPSEKNSCSVDRSQPCVVHGHICELLCVVELGACKGIECAWYSEGECHLQPLVPRHSAVLCCVGGGGTRHLSSLC